MTIGPEGRKEGRKEMLEGRNIEKKVKKILNEMEKKEREIEIEIERDTDNTLGIVILAKTVHREASLREINRPQMEALFTRDREEEVEGGREREDKRDGSGGGGVGEGQNTGNVPYGCSWGLLGRTPLLCGDKQLALIAQFTTWTGTDSKLF